MKFGDRISSVNSDEIMAIKKIFNIPETVYKMSFEEQVRFSERLVADNPEKFLAYDKELLRIRRSQKSNQVIIDELCFRDDPPKPSTPVNKTKPGNHLHR